MLNIFNSFKKKNSFSIKIVVLRRSQIHKTKTWHSDPSRSKEKNVVPLARK